MHTERATQAQALLDRLLQSLETVIRGKREVLELLLGCVAAGGHVLLEDVPGTGKTTLKALAGPVLAHRLVLDTRARYAGTDKRTLTRDIAAGVPVPR